MRLLEAILIDDDQRVLELLVKHGRATELEPTLPGPMRQHAVWADDENFYAATHYFGYENPSDNGYRAIVIPKNGTADDDAAAVLDFFISDGQDASGAVFSEMREIQPELN